MEENEEKSEDLRRPTPEQVAMRESMNRDYYQAPRVNFYCRKKTPVKKRTNKEHYYYMKNKIHMKNYKIRKLKRELAEEVSKNTRLSRQKAEAIKLKIKKQKELLSLIIVPEYKPAEY
jgi:hypothetical protein